MTQTQVTYLERALAREVELNDAFIAKLTAPYEEMDSSTAAQQERVPGHTTLRARREELSRLSREARAKMDAEKQQEA